MANSHLAGLDGRLEEASRLLNGGDLDRAEALVNDVLREDEQLAQALTLAGVIAQRRGNSEAAITFVNRALAVDPALLLMDEPFSALDAQTREYMQQELLNIWERDRVTAVFVTHQIDEAVYLSDRVFVFARRPGRRRLQRRASASRSIAEGCAGASGWE